MAGIIAKRPTAIKKQVKSCEAVKQALEELEQEAQEDIEEWNHYFDCEESDPCDLYGFPI